MQAFQPQTSLLSKPAPFRGARPAAVPSIVHEVLDTPGEPLDSATRSFMEPRFGHDFSQVRVHATPGAATSAAAVQARAYTVGQHIVLGAGSPSRGSLSGRLLLAHELAHVVQQSGGRGAAPEVSPSAPHEADARAAAQAVATGGEARVASRTGIGLARQAVNEMQGVVMVAGDLVEETLGLVTRNTGEIEEALATIRDMGGEKGATADRLLREIEGSDLAERHRHLRQAQEAAADFVRDRLRSSSRGNRLTTILEALRWEALGQDERAARAREHLNRIERLRERVRQLDEARRAAQAPPKFQAPPDSARKVKSPPKEPKKLAPPSAGVKTVPVSGSSAATAGAKVESTVAGAASAEVKAAAHATRAGSGLSKLGGLGFNLLLPGPLDAIALMVQFAGSYAEAQEAIRNRNTRVGFSIGLSAALLNRSHRAVRRHLSRKFVLDREVHTQVVGAVGIAEKSHNAGLDSGFRYGEILSGEARDALREIGFSILLEQGRLPADRNELFSAEGVWRLAGALGPTVDQIFEAMRKEAERQREEERRKARQEMGWRGMKF